MRRVALPSVTALLDTAGKPACAVERYGTELVLTSCGPGALICGSGNTCYAPPSI
jgi:hypothetical protein